MVTARGNFPNRPYTLRVETWYNWQSGSAAAVHVEVYIDGTYGSYSPGGGSSWNLEIDSRGSVASWSGGFDFRDGQSSRLIHAGDYNATTNINGDIGVHAYANFDVLGYTEAHVAIDGYPLTTPPAPTMNQPSNVTINSMRTTFNGNGDGGSGILEWRLEYGTDSTFATYTALSSSGTNDVTGLTPGTTYYFRALGRNAVGWGAYSNKVSQATIPSTGPTLSVSSGIAGTTATALVIPPNNVSGVTKFNLEYRLGSSGTVIPRTSNASSFAISGLTPGASYQYRGQIEIGTYVSPWSSWTAFVQTNPNTNPGDYYDGATADTADTDFSWTGTANASTSVATFKNVLGWMQFADGNSTSGGTGVVAQVTGNFYTGTKGARVTFTSDTTAAGFIFGIHASGAAAASEGNEYNGSINIRLPSRGQRLQAGLAWINGSDGIISYTWGNQFQQAAEPNNIYARWPISGFAPAGTVKVATVIRDVTGTGWSTWKGGDVILMDGAMIAFGNALPPYFDGGSVDTTEYVYEWTGTPGNSASTRYPNTGEFIDPLRDPDCVPLPMPPLPPSIASDCIEEVGIWRRYTLGIDGTDVRLWGSTLPTLVLTTGVVEERQVRIRFYENPGNLAPELMDTTTYDAEMILTYIPAGTEITLDSVTQRVRASVNGGDSIVANQLLYGTGGAPASWPELRCGIGYVITLDVPTNAPSGNLGTRVYLTQRV